MQIEMVEVVRDGRERGTNGQEERGRHKDIGKRGTRNSICQQCGARCILLCAARVTKSTTNANVLSFQFA